MPSAEKWQNNQYLPLIGKRYTRCPGLHKKRKFSKLSRAALGKVPGEPAAHSRLGPRKRTRLAERSHRSRRPVSAGRKKPPKTGGRRKKEVGGDRTYACGVAFLSLGGGMEGAGTTPPSCDSGVSRLRKSPGKPRKPGKPPAGQEFTRFTRFTRRFQGNESDHGAPGVRRKISGSERDRAGNSTGVLTRDSESFDADSRGSRGTVTVPLEP